MRGTGSGLLRRCGPWHRIAVLRPGRIGDYLCATPAVRALRRAAPGARLDYVGLPLVRDLVARNPCVDRFVAFPGFPNIAEQFFSPRSAVAWLARMQDERYDLVVQLYGSGVYANPIAQLIGARCCAGFVRPDDHVSLDAAIPLPEHGAEVDRALALVRHLGAPAAGRGYDLWLTAADRAAAARLLYGLPRPVIGVHCGARDAGRRIAPQRLGRAAAALGEGSLVVLGGGDERAFGAPLVAAAGGLPHRDLAGAVPLATAAAVVAGLDALLTTDSAPAHLAYAAGTPCVAVFVASDPRRWGPPDPGPYTVLDCRAGPGAQAAVLAEAVRRRLDGRDARVRSSGTRGVVR